MVEFTDFKELGGVVYDDQVVFINAFKQVGTNFSPWNDRDFMLNKWFFLLFISVF